LMDRLCTEVVGLDGRGEASLFGSVTQWLTAYEKATIELNKPAVVKVATAVAAPQAKSKKLTFKEQKEWEGMEAAILVAEESVVARQAEVEAAANAGHGALTTACQNLEAAQRAVERLYARWEELEAKRT